MGIVDGSKSVEVCWDNAEQCTDGTKTSVTFLLAILLRGLKVTIGTRIIDSSGNVTIPDYVVENGKNRYYCEITDDPNPDANPRKAKQLKIGRGTVGKQYKLFGSKQIDRIALSERPEDIFE